MLFALSVYLTFGRNELSQKLYDAATAKSQLFRHKSHKMAKAYHKKYALL